MNINFKCCALFLNVFISRCVKYVMFTFIFKINLNLFYLQRRFWTVHIILLAFHISEFITLHVWLGENIEVYEKDQALVKKSHMQIKALLLSTQLVRCMHLPVLAVICFFKCVFILLMWLNFFHPINNDFTWFNAILSFICL